MSALKPYFVAVANLFLPAAEIKFTEAAVLGRYINEASHAAPW